MTFSALDAFLFTCPLAQVNTATIIIKEGKSHVFSQGSTWFLKRQSPQLPVSYTS